MTALVIHGRAEQHTSPPYFALRSYTDGGEHYAGQIGSEPTPAEFLEAQNPAVDRSPSFVAGFLGAALRRTPAGFPVADPEDA